jgi:hypothetical protein
LLIKNVVPDPLVVILLRDDSTRLDILELINIVIGHCHQWQKVGVCFHFGNFIASQDMDGKPEGDDTDAGLAAKADGLVAILRLFVDPPADEALIRRV